MKVREIAERYSIDELDFDRFLMIKDMPCKKTFSGTVIADEHVEKYVAAFHEWKSSLGAKSAKKVEEDKEIQERLKNFMLTTSCSFEGYTVEKYVDVLFDEMLVGLGFGKAILSGFDNTISALTGTESTTMIEKLNEVKTRLKQRLMQDAARMGANAMLGIDFESSKLGELIMVSMTGTAVVIKKADSHAPENR